MGWGENQGMSPCLVVFQPMSPFLAIVSHLSPPSKVPDLFNSWDILGFCGHPSLGPWYSAFSFSLASSLYFLLLEVCSHCLLLFPFHSVCPGGLMYLYVFVLILIEYNYLCSVHHVLTRTSPLLTLPFPKIAWNPHLLFLSLLFSLFLLCNTFYFLFFLNVFIN